MKSQAFYTFTQYQAMFPALSAKTSSSVSLHIKPRIDTTVRGLHWVALIQNLKIVTYVHKGYFLSGKERRKKGREGSRQAGSGEGEKS